MKEMDLKYLDLKIYQLRITWRQYEHPFLFCMMVIAFFTFSSSLEPLIEGVRSWNLGEFELSGFRRNWTDNLRINSPSVLPIEPHLRVRSKW